MSMGIDGGAGSGSGSTSNTGSGIGGTDRGGASAGAPVSTGSPSTGTPSAITSTGPTSGPTGIASAIENQAASLIAPIIAHRAQAIRTAANESASAADSVKPILAVAAGVGILFFLFK
jgi:hypothetical protein